MALEVIVGLGALKDLDPRQMDNYTITLGMTKGELDRPVTHRRPSPSASPQNITAACRKCLTITIIQEDEAIDLCEEAGEQNRPYTDCPKCGLPLYLDDYLGNQASR